MFSRTYILLFLMLQIPVCLLADPGTDSIWLVSHYTKEEVYITMRDGTRLYTAIYSPKAEGKHPILMTL